MKKTNQYCQCTEDTNITTLFEDEFGYWKVCEKCGKKLEDGHFYYNHYEGEDHDVDLEQYH